jgi:ABC-type lipoprotein export system ATPase subunit
VATVILGGWALAVGHGVGVVLDGVAKSFNFQPVLSGISIGVPAGSFVSLSGPSGCGKSTLLNLIAGLEAPSQGRVVVDDRDLSLMALRQRDQFRLQTTAFVFQFFHLLPTLTVLENVCLPAFEKWQDKTLRQQVEAKAREMLERLGLIKDLNKFPRELSGGMQSRVGFVRAILLEPKLLLADEPTGSLDRASGAKLLDELQDYHARSGCTLFLVTHDQDAAARAPHRVALLDGRIVTSSLV